LFSGKANAFGVREVSAVQRLSEMVETAVRLARATQSLPERLKMGETSAAEVSAGEVTPIEDDQILDGEILADIVLQDMVLAAPKKPLFWSAVLSPAAEAERAVQADQSHVPPVLRSLRKCEACGFPVSASRVLCVECEEKKWRGQLKVAKAGGPVQTGTQNFV